MRRAGGLPGFALGRIGNPPEIVGAALYFASDASSFTTGVAAARRRRDAVSDVRESGSGGTARIARFGLQRRGT